MKLKLDLHPIYSDSDKIEASLRAIIDEACDKRASEIEIIPGKGSGALKKSVLRFLNQPEVKARYHRIEKDSDNFGRLFVHFRWDRSQDKAGSAENPKTMVMAPCFCCGVSIEQELDSDDFDGPLQFFAECGSCGSPNEITVRKTKSCLDTKAESGYS